jgi:hypothetical protein
MAEIDLGQYTDKYLLLRQARADKDRAVMEYERRLAEFRAIVGDHDTASIDGVVVVTNEKIKTFRAKDFAADHPVLAKEFTKPVVKDVLDVDALAVRHPALYELYRSRQFLVKDV